MNQDDIVLLKTIFGESDNINGLVAFMDANEYKLDMRGYKLPVYYLNSIIKFADLVKNPDLNRFLSINIVNKNKSILTVDEKVIFNSDINITDDYSITSVISITEVNNADAVDEEYRISFLKEHEIFSLYNNAMGMLYTSINEVTKTIKVIFYNSLNTFKDNDNISADILINNFINTNGLFEMPSNVLPEYNNKYTYKDISLADGIKITNNEVSRVSALLNKCVFVPKDKVYIKRTSNY